MKYMYTERRRKRAKNTLIMCVYYLFLLVFVVCAKFRALTAASFRRAAVATVRFVSSESVSYA